MSDTMLIELKPTEFKKAAELLSRAFIKDVQINWFFDSKIAYEKQSKSVFKSWLSYCRRYGQLYRTEDFTAVMALKAPGNHRISLWRAICTGLVWNPWQLGKNGFDRLQQFTDSAERIIVDQGYNDQYWYVWLLGTLPEKQGRGYGSALLDQLLALQKSQNVPAILETGSKRAKEFYEKNGFFCAKKFKLTEQGPEIYCMIRPIPGRR